MFATATSLRGDPVEKIHVSICALQENVTQIRLRMLE
jgi:hypothetical protein